MINVLIVDDEYIRHSTIRKVAFKNQECEIFNAFSYEEAVEYLEEIKFDYVFLDHDLGEAKKTGYDLAKYILENKNPEDVGSMFVHSMNPVGANNIAQLLQSRNFICSAKPFSSFT